MDHRYLLAGVLSCLLIVSAASALELNQFYITVDQQGNAVMDVTYHVNPAEYLGAKGLIVASSPFVTNMQSRQRPNLSNNNMQVVCVEPGDAELVMPHFAQIDKTTFTTTTIDLNKYAGKAVLPGGYQYPLNMMVNATIVFPDGYSVEQDRTTIIQSVSHALQKTKTTPPPPPTQTCRKATLPLSGIIPQELAPVAAAGIGIAVTALGLTSIGTAISAWLAKMMVFLGNALGQITQGRIADKHKEERTFSDGYDRKLLFGFTHKELIVIGSGALVIGLLFYFAARLPVNLVDIAIYIVMGGIALMTHEMAHWYMNRKYQSTTEIQFYGMGTVIMALTSWLFGSVFGQPTLTLVHEKVPLEKQSLGQIMLAGPVLSIIIACACLLLIPLGGLFSTAGIIGFSINLLQAVFEMLPINPCDGKDVYHWNKAIWAVFFIPLILLYFLVNL
jgi:Zn-dependent protease